MFVQYSRVLGIRHSFSTMAAEMAKDLNAIEKLVESIAKDVRDGKKIQEQLGQVQVGQRAFRGRPAYALHVRSRLRYPPLKRQQRQSPIWRT